MSSTKKYLIFVIEPFGAEEREKAELFRGKRNLAHYRNARFFEFEQCDGVVLGKNVSSVYPQIGEAYEQAGIQVEDLDTVAQEDAFDPKEQEQIIPEPSENVYEWTRKECWTWLKNRNIPIPKDGYLSRSDLQVIVLENIANA